MKLPNKILVYVLNEDGDDCPVLCVATSMDEIPEDCNGKIVGKYELVSKSKVEATRKLKLCK